MKRPSMAGWSGFTKPMLGFVTLIVVLLAAFGWTRLRPVAEARPEPGTKLDIVSVPTNDTAVETWRVVPAPAHPLAAPRAERRVSPRASRAVAPGEPDWNTLSAPLADEPAGNAISLGAPAELESGLSPSERERLIAADEDQRMRPERPGRGRGTVVVGRGTPGGGGGRGRCD